MSLDPSREPVILSARRTPFGAFGGALRDLTATDLGVHAAAAAIAASGLAPADVEQVVMGNVLQTSADAIYLARHVGLRAGVPIEAPALTVNRLCGSGFEAVIEAARLVAAGEAEVVLAGGTESMSQAPLVLRGARWGHPLGRPPAAEDLLWSALTDSWAGMAMGLTAERLGAEQGITQDEVDACAVRSQRRWAEADAAGRFAAELAPVPLPGGARGRRRSTATSTRARRRPWRGSGACRGSSRPTGSSTPGRRAGWPTAPRPWWSPAGLAPRGRGSRRWPGSSPGGTPASIRGSWGSARCRRSAGRSTGPASPSGSST